MSKPRVKSGLPPEVGTDRHMWQLLRLMDGSCTVEQLCDAMRGKGSRLTDEGVKAMLEHADVRPDCPTCARAAGELRRPLRHSAQMRVIRMASAMT